MAMKQIISHKQETLNDKKIVDKCTRRNLTYKYKHKADNLFANDY